MITYTKKLNVLLLLLICRSVIRAENGYNLWLVYIPFKKSIIAE